MKGKTVFLILLLVVTAIPTVIFILNLILFLSYYLQGATFLWVNWNAPLDEEVMILYYDGGVGMYMWVFVLGLICIPLFFASVLLLYKEWQNRKRLKAKKTMTYTV